MARTCTGSQGRGASSGVAGDGDGRGPDDLAADAPPYAFLRGGPLFPPPVDCRGAVDDDGSNGGDKKWKSNSKYQAVTFGTRSNSYRLQKLPGFPQPQYKGYSSV